MHMCGLYTALPRSTALGEVLRHSERHLHNWAAETDPLRGHSGCRLLRHYWAVQHYNVPMWSDIIF